MKENGMKLFLHCGYHKTGSSFLQTLFSRNRDYLQKNGYHFPVASREYDMQSGNVSPGNGPELAAALKHNNSRESSELIAGYVADAQKKGCGAVLLSSENFFHAFEKQHALECLTKVCKENHITEILALLYLRDPVSHALSTYKHRAKKGRIPDFTEWLRNEYETTRLTERFMEYKDQFPVEWTCRKYRSDSLHMAKSAFADWLALETPEIPEDDRVNTSLTLSELMTIQTLNENRPGLIPFVQQAFAEIPAGKKGNDVELSRWFNSIAYSVLSDHSGLITKVNDMLPDDEPLTLQPVEAETGSSVHNEIVLSKTQVKAFTEALEAGVKSEQVIHKSRALLSKVLDRINRKMKTFTA